MSKRAIEVWSQTKIYAQGASVQGAQRTVHWPGGPGKLVYAVASVAGTPDVSISNLQPDDSPGGAAYPLIPGVPTLPLSPGVTVNDVLDFEAGPGVVVFTINLGTVGDYIQVHSLYLVPL